MMASEASKVSIAGDSKKRKRHPTWSRNLGNDMVLIIVGPSNEPFSIHKDLLCLMVDYFDKMFNGEFKEATDKTVNFPEDNVEAFRLFVSWVYIDDINFKNQRTIGYPHLAEVFHFAEKYVIPSLQDHIMVHAVRRSNFGPDMNAIGLGYKLTSKGSKYRLLMARYYAFAIANNEDDKSGNLGTSAIHDLARKYDDLHGDALSVMRNLNRNYRGLSQPDEYPPCDYHHHAGGEPCPYGKKLS